MMKKSQYSASFTAGSLLYNETNGLLPLLLSENSEELINYEIKQNNHLKINSESSRKRITSEIVKRFSAVDKQFWEYYENRKVVEQKAMLFYLCLKFYKLIFDFHFNVTIKQWNSSIPMIEPFLFQMELNEISANDETVYGWKDDTKKKVVSVYLRILNEIGMLDDKQHRLQPLSIENDFFQYFVQKRELWFLDACLMSTQMKKHIIGNAL